MAFGEQLTIRPVYAGEGDMRHISVHHFLLNGHLVDLLVIRQMSHGNVDIHTWSAIMYKLLQVGIDLKDGKCPDPVLVHKELQKLCDKHVYCWEYLDNIVL